MPGMEEKAIQLLQFFICRDFTQDGRDSYTSRFIHSNLTASKFPYQFSGTYVVTCWRKDKQFHKETIEYSADGKTLRTPPMDVEPVTNSVLFRWHKHLIPEELVIEKSGLLTVRVVLDWKVHFESYVMIESAG